VPDARDAVREAERLVREATERAEAIVREGAARVPPRGFDTPGGGEGGAPPFPDLSALAGLVELARGTVPRELQRQLAQALRELLIALRAVLDYSIARLEAETPAPAPVEDIPIE
jgi:hypothetical protein